MERISPEARRAAAEAAEAAGMPLEVWLSQLIKYVSAMEKQDRDGQAREEPAPQERSADAVGELEPELTPQRQEPRRPGGPVDEDRRPPGPAQSAGRPAPAEPAAAEPEDEAPVTLTEEADADDDGADGTRDGADAPAAAASAAASRTVVPWPSTRPRAGSPARNGDAGGRPTVVTAPIDALHPSRFAIDQEPAEAEIEAALEAWRRGGTLEPIVVRNDPHRPGAYEIIAGGERWRAAARAQLDDVPVMVQEMSDQEALRTVLVQRLRSKANSPVDAARIYRRLMREGGSSADELARAIGKSPAHVIEMVDLLDLPEAVQEMVEAGELTVLHGRALLRAADPESAAREVVARRLDIYQTEQLVRSAKNRQPGQRPATAGSKPGDSVATVQLLERQLSSLLGLKVSITERNEVGVLSVHYTSRDQLSDLISRLNTSGGG